MNSINFKNYIDHSIILGFVFLAFGYYLSGSIAVLINVDSRIINIGYRGIIILLFIIPFLSILTFKPKFSRGEIFFLIFWFLYSTRIFYDLIYAGIEYNNTYNKGITNEFIFLILFCNILIPVFVLASYDLDRLTQKIFTYSYFILIVSTIVLVYSILNSPAYINRALYGGRITLGLEGANTINPIKISLLGTLGIITWVFRLLNFNVKFKEKLLLVFLLGLSIFLLTTGASRGPLLLTMICIVVIVFNYLKNQKSLYQKIKIYTIITFVLVNLVIYLKNNSDDLIVYNRIVKTVERINKGKEEERNIVYRITWNQFLNDPVLGSSFLTINEDNDYDRVIPHNLILESLISIGIFGTIFLLLTLSSFLYKLYMFNSFSYYKQFFILITFCFFIHGLISGSILLDVELWAIMGLTLAINKDI